MNKSANRALSVLLVEDQEVDSMLIKRLLDNQQVGAFEVDHAWNLDEAVARLASNDYDAALLDLELPDGQGIDSLHRLRAVDARLPIVVLTGHQDETLGLQAIECGAQDFLSKAVISGQILYRVLSYGIARQRKVLGYAAAAHTDSLTELPNRRLLDQRFEELAGSSDQLHFVLLDVDHFKSVNDTYGHTVGDFVLKRFADVLRSQVNDTDQGEMARYGGEEFVILYPDSSDAEVLQKVSDLLSAIEQTTLSIDGETLSVTASAGIAKVGEQESCDKAATRADVALYTAKKTGRNRCCVANSAD